MKNEKQRGQHEIWGVMSEKYFAIEVECRAKSFFHVPSVFLGRLLQANELALVCSLIGAFTNVDAEISV